MIEQFWMRLQQENPELCNDLQHDYPSIWFIQQQIDGVLITIETLQRAGIQDAEICTERLNELIEELSPARFLFVKKIFESTLRDDLPAFKETGLLNSVILHIVVACKPVFRHYGFQNQGSDDKNLAYAIGLMVKFFLEDFDKFLKH